MRKPQGKRETTATPVKAAGKPKTIDEYLSTLPDDKRIALEKMRKSIRAAAPKAEECFSYGLPAFRMKSPLVAFGASANHCALYPLSPAVIQTHAKELKEYETSKGTIRFPAAKPLPAALVRKIVKARMEETGAVGK